MSSPASACFARSGRIDGSHSSEPQNDVDCAGLERELHGLAHGQLGEQRRGLERAAEPARGRAGAPACC